MFNFYTAYLSIVIFDSAFLGYLIFRNKEKIISQYKISLFKERVEEYFSDKNNIFCFASLVFIIVISIMIQMVIINDSDSLIYTDPFKWYQTVFYLIDNGHIEYEYLDYNYPSGHTFFNAGVLLIYPDYIFGYYYFKLISLYMLSLYIIIAFIIIRKLFKKHYLVILALLFILISRYFIARTILYLSSSLASIILVISILIVINKYPDYIIGIFLAGLYLIHPLTTFYYIFVLFSFYVFKFLLFIKNRKNFLKQTYSIVILISISLVLLIPYFLSIYIVYNDSFFDFLVHFSERFTNFEDSLYNVFYEDLNNYLLEMVFPLEFFEPIIDVRLLDVFDEIFRNSIFLFFIFAIIGLLIYVKPKKSQKDLEILAYFKFFIIMIIIFFFLPSFFYNLGFFIKFRKRILQSFCLPVIIITVYAIEWVVNKARLFTDYLIHKFAFYKKFINSRKPYSRLFRIDSIMVGFLLVSASSTYYINRWPDFYYYYDDNLVEVVLYLRENADPDSVILREELDSAVIFRMLYDMKVKEWDLKENSTYEELLLEVQQRDIDYLIFPKDYLDNERIEDYLSRNPDFKEKLENSDYILFKT
ncbi:MAG: hypothetical protein ACFE8A_03340 [Candidatus Hodarchaeota archaeon]